jgi:hypothetical protein
MITLKKDRGFVQVEKWEEVTSLPGFVANLNRSQHKIKDIVGRYIFPHTINCGLSDCHSPHKRGYVVSTESGELTNIGWMCGSEYFGDDFEMLSRQFERDVEDQTNRETLASFSFRADLLQAAVDALRDAEHGADWVYKCTRPLLQAHRGCPEPVVRKIAAMLKAGQNQLTEDRQATARETEIAEAAAGRSVPQPYMISEVVAQISGMAALNPQNDLRQLLVIETHEELKTFRELDIDSLTHNDLRRWAKWIASNDARLERADAAIAAGRELLTEDNLAPFFRFLTDNADTKEYWRYLASLSEK